MQNGRKRTQRGAVSQASLKVKSSQAVVKKCRSNAANRARRMVKCSDLAGWALVAPVANRVRSEFQCKTRRAVPRMRRKLAKESPWNRCRARRGEEQERRPTVPRATMGYSRKTRGFTLVVTFSTTGGA